MKNKRCLPAQLLGLALLLASAAPTAAQSGKPVLRNHATPVERAQEQTQELKRDLRLTPAQEARVFQINLAAAQKRSDMAHLKGTTAGENAAVSIRTEQERDIRALLTSAQQALWAAREKQQTRPVGKPAPRR